MLFSDADCVNPSIRYVQSNEVSKSQHAIAKTAEKSLEKYY